MYFVLFKKKKWAENVYPSGRTEGAHGKQVSTFTSPKSSREAHCRLSQTAYIACRTEKEARKSSLGLVVRARSAEGFLRGFDEVLIESLLAVCSS